ncbi:MAG: DUF6465 family protein [Defluviitaleaceae bacterium]|nr:DUF6465 family protein [Defluviitaleaceae bacterium]
MKTEIFVEIDGKQVDIQGFIDIIKDIWKSEGNLVKDLKDLKVYFKPNEQMCYYVINGGVEGKFEVN